MNIFRTRGFSTVSLESVEIFTPLGIRFWDPAVNRQVNDGLWVTARPADGSTPPRPAFRTASGIYAFQNLPGLRSIERPDSDNPPEGSLPVARDFLVEVIDMDGRYQPVLFQVTVPVQGIYRNQVPGAESTPVGSQPSQPGATRLGFYLFSAPGRQPIPGSACIRATLVVAGTEHRAAFAVLEANVGGDRWASFADEKGNVVLIFPPPPVLTAPVIGSEPARFQRPPYENSWPVRLRARYQPGALDYPPPAPSTNSRQRGPVQTVPLPTLRSILHQAPAGLLSREDTAAVEEWQIELFFAQEMILKTSGLPSLLLVPGGSQP